MNTTGNIKKNSPTQVGALTANNPKFQYVVDEFNKEMGADEMKEEIKDELLGAIRQYRHNDNSGFVKAYDFDTVNQIVEKLLSQQREEIKTLKAEKVAAIEMLNAYADETKELRNENYDLELRLSQQREEIKTLKAEKVAAIEMLNAYADETKELRNENYDLELRLSQQREDKWISVKDKLPDYIEGEDYSENVFTTDGINLYVMARCYIDEDGQKGWLWANCWGDIDGEAELDDDYSEITHWMPLPNPKLEKK